MSSPNIKLWSLQQLYSASDECRLKSQLLREQSDKHLQKSQSLKFRSRELLQKSQSLRFRSCQQLQKSYQLKKTHSDKGFGRIEPLPSDQAAQEQVIEQLPSNPNEYLLTLMQSQSDLDARLEMIQECQSDVGSRLAMLEQLESDLDKHLAKVNDLIKHPQLGVPDSEVSSEYSDDAELKKTLENLQGLIKKFVTGWSEGDDKHLPADSIDSLKTSVTDFNYSLPSQRLPIPLDALRVLDVSCSFDVKD